MNASRRGIGRTGFCIAIAIGLVATRLVIVDYQFLVPTTLPPHDMYQGAAYFSTNLHSLRMEGDLAWWNPTADVGYAQYYQSFLSPLAPTCGHIVFILWAFVTRALATVGIQLPEYLQYVAITYVVMQSLAYWAFLWFCSFILASRAAILLAGIVYAFSGIGLWQSAWFYFQEPFTLYVLLATVVGALQRPVPSRLLLVLAALLVQIASTNYWTVHNSWFLLIVVGGYAMFHQNQVKRLARRLRSLWQTRRTATVTAVAAATLTAVVWIGMLASIVLEQGTSYARTQRAAGAGAYGSEEASAHIQELRSFTTDLFNPGFADALMKYPRDNPVHNARYLGAELVPLLAAFAAMAWRRRERWLLTCAVIVLCVCLGPPLLLSIWATAPGFSNIVHFFYFYSHHLQVVVLLMAAAALDAVLTRSQRTTTRRRVKLAVAASVAISVLVLVELGVFTTVFPSGDVRLQGALLYALFSLVVGVPLLRQAVEPSAMHRRVLVGVLLAVLSADLTRYFWLVERADIAFTVDHRFLQDVEHPFSARLQALLRRPWAAPDLAQGFDGGVARNMPIVSSVWPTNYYVVPRYVMELSAAARGAVATPRADFGFFPSDRVRRASGDPGEVAAPHGELLLAPDGTATALPAPGNTSQGSGAFGYAFRSWRYNGFGVDLQVPRDGWIVISQLFDPAWRVQIDGRSATLKRAEHMLMAVPVDAGTHTLAMEYRPLARALYWPASMLLLATCGGLLVASHRAARARHHWP